MVTKTSPSELTPPLSTTPGTPSIWELLVSGIRTEKKEAEISGEIWVIPTARCVAFGTHRSTGRQTIPRKHAFEP